MMEAMTVKMKRIEVPFDVKSVDDGGTFAGYASVFGTLDAYDEVVAPGAFADSIKDWQSRGKMPPILWQHRSDQPIGVHTVMREDSKGLYIEGKLAVDDVQRAKEARSLLQLGAISGISIGYIPIEESYNRDTGVTTLEKINLWENSIVTFPANPDAQVTGVKRLDDLSNIRECEDYLREACGLSRAESKAFLARYGRMVQREAETLNSVKRLEALLR
jgi:HK97 family phage prohead protease